jgi:hypothetical protein
MRHGPTVVAILLRSWRWRAVATTSMVEGEMVQCAASVVMYHSRHILLWQSAWEGVMVNLGGVLSPLGGGCATPHASARWDPKMHLSKALPDLWLCQLSQHL